MSTDPMDVARKVAAAAPSLKMPPTAEFIKDADGRVVDFKMPGMGFRRKARNRIGMLLFNMFMTHIPSHTIRLQFLRMFGATIGTDSAIMRGTSVFDIEFLSIGDNTAIGNRCLLDARGGISIGSNCSIASDVHILGGGHDINSPDFLPVPIPTVIQDYVWIASRAMILPALIRRGAVVGAQALVVKDIDELTVVGGVPGKVIGKRNADALVYKSKFRPLFF